jgi:hypothetical protein
MTETRSWAPTVAVIGMGIIIEPETTPQIANSKMVLLLSKSASPILETDLLMISTTRMRDVGQTHDI